MPDWIFDLPLGVLAAATVSLFTAVSLVGLYLARRFVLPHLTYHDGINDAISGTVQAIGVFYGITVGLIAVGAWNTHSAVGDLVTREAAAIAAMYRDVSTYPDPPRSVLQAQLRDYTSEIISVDWPEHRKGRIPATGTRLLDRFQFTLASFEPATEGQKIIHGEAFRAFNELVLARRMRLDAVGSDMSPIMWLIIWAGAAISISIGYFFRIEDFKLHALLIGFTAAFLGLVVFLIIANDRPFAGDFGVSPASYELVLNQLINASP